MRLQRIGDHLSMDGNREDIAGNSGHPESLARTPAAGSAPSQIHPANGLMLGAYAGDGASSGPEYHLWDYINLIARRRWTVLAAFVLCLLVGAVFSFTATPLYTSTALLKIKPGNLQVMDFDSIQETTAQSQSYTDFYQTQYDLLGSRALARRTIGVLGLDREPFFNGDYEQSSILGRLKAWRESVARSGMDEETLSALERKELVDRFLEHVKVSPRRRSFLVDVSFESPDPELSRLVADTMSNEYINLTLDQSVETAGQVRDFIQKQVWKVKASLENAEEELQAFARGHEIAALEQEERVIDERLADLNSRLTEAEAERIAAEALHDQAQTNPAQDIQTISDNPLMKALREELARTEAERAEVGSRFTDKYPAVQTLDARIARLRASIATEEDRLIASIGVDHDQARMRESLLRAQLDSQKQLVAEHAEKAIAFKIHQREVDTTRQLYEDLLRRMKEVEVTEAIRASNINLVDPAERPVEPSSPRILMSLAFSMFIGLFLGVGLAFGQEYMDDSLSTPDDIERYLRLSTLGIVPEFEANPGADVLEGQTPDLEVANQPASAGSEAIRSLRASLFLAAPGGLPTRLLMTSARPGEGKTCITVNLATALAQMGRKVCVIDCDLRRPRVNKALSISLSPGVTNHLTGGMTLDEITRPSGQPGLDVIAAGPIPPNPVDLLNSAKMTHFLRDLEERYDHILIDAPPALGFADVPIVADQMGGAVLLVTRSGQTSRRLVKQTCDYLTRMQTKLLGVVLNRVSTRQVGYSYYGYYGYYGDYYARRDEDETLSPSRSNAA